MVMTSVWHPFTNTGDLTKYLKEVLGLPLKAGLNKYFDSIDYTYLFGASEVDLLVAYSTAYNAYVNNVQKKIKNCP